MISVKRYLSAGLLGLLTIALAGCAVKGETGNATAGEKLFTANCGGCHVLAAAKTKGTTGPNLDDAFRESRREGFGSEIVFGVVDRQIAYPNINGVMPAKIVTGKNSRDVAAYVAKVAGVSK